LVKAKGLRKARRERCGQQGINPETNFKPIQHHGNEIHMVGNPSYEHGGTSEIQCNYGKKGEGAKKNPIF
jgi:hypothetical protein